jgi:hypothetical protein
MLVIDNRCRLIHEFIATGNDLKERCQVISAPGNGPGAQGSIKTTELAQDRCPKRHICS